MQFSVETEVQQFVKKHFSPTSRGSLRPQKLQKKWTYFKRVELCQFSCCRDDSHIKMKLKACGRDYRFCFFFHFLFYFFFCSWDFYIEKFMKNPRNLISFFHILRRIKNQTKYKKNPETVVSSTCFQLHFYM